MKPARFCKLLETKYEVYKNPTHLTMWEKKGYFVAGKDKHGRRKFITSDADLMLRISAMEALPDMSPEQIKDAIEGNDTSLPGDMLKQINDCETKWFPILRGWINGKSKQDNRKENTRG